MGIRRWDELGGPLRACLSFSKTGAPNFLPVQLFFSPLLFGYIPLYLMSLRGGGAATDLAVSVPQKMEGGFQGGGENYLVR